MGTKVVIRNQAEHYVAGLFFSVVASTLYDGTEVLEHELEYVDDIDAAMRERARLRDERVRNGEQPLPEPRFIDADGLRQLYDDREVVVVSGPPRPANPPPTVSNPPPATEAEKQLASEDRDARIASLVAAEVAKALAAFQAKPSASKTEKS